MFPGYGGQWRKSEMLETQRNGPTDHKGRQAIFSAPAGFRNLEIQGQGVKDMADFPTGSCQFHLSQRMDIL